MRDSLCNEMHNVYNNSNCQVQSQCINLLLKSTILYHLLQNEKHRNRSDKNDLIKIL